MSSRGRRSGNRPGQRLVRRILKKLLADIHPHCAPRLSLAAIDAREELKLHLATYFTPTHAT